MAGGQMHVGDSPAPLRPGLKFARGGRSSTQGMRRVAAVVRNLGRLSLSNCGCGPSAGYCADFR